MQSVEPMMAEVDFADDPVEDLEERLKTLSADGRRIAPIKFKGELAWVLFSYEDVMHGLGNDKEVPAAPEYIINWDTQGSQPLKMVGDEHRQNRSVLEAPFKAKEIRRMAGELLVPLADKVIDDFGDAREIDLIAAYTHRYTFLVIAGILGVPIEDEHYLRELVYNLLQGGRGNAEQRRLAALEAVEKMNDFLRPIVEDRRKNPRDDLISGLLSARVNGELLDETTLYDYIRFLFPAGAETTHVAMGRLMNTVLADEALKQRLIDNPQDRMAAVDEVMRFAPPAVLQPRTLERETNIGGVDLPAGSKLLFSILNGNRDPKVFAEPDQFSIDHKRKPILSFGTGPHYCLGIHLAKAELVVSLSRLLERLPGLRLASTPPGPIGAQLRWVSELKVTFDDIVPGKTAEALAA